MLRIVTRLLLAPTLALAATGATMVVAPTGAQAAVTATIRVGGALKVRSAPNSGAKLVGTVKNRAKVQLACSVTGQVVKGTVRRTAQWDRLTSGNFISHAYVNGNVKLPTCAALDYRPPAPVVVPVSTPSGTMTDAQFLAAAGALAQQSQRQTRVPASVTTAQAILESGWGRSMLAANHRNYFGMKCFTQGSYANGCYTYNTTECSPDGVCFPTTAVFRTYATVLDSFNDHGALLAGAARYAPAFQYTRDPNMFAAEIHRAGYATDPLYTVKLTALMAKYNLYQYDLKV